MISTCCLINLPTDVSCEVISQFLNVKDLMVLDPTFCNNLDRGDWLLLLAHDHSQVKQTVGSFDQ